MFRDMATFTQLNPHLGLCHLAWGGGAALLLLERRKPRQAHSRGMTSFHFTQSLPTVYNSQSLFQSLSKYGKI